MKMGIDNCCRPVWRREGRLSPVCPPFCLLAWRYAHPLFLFVHFRHVICCTFRLIGCKGLPSWVLPNYAQSSCRIWWLERWFWEPVQVADDLAANDTSLLAFRPIVPHRPVQGNAPSPGYHRHLQTKTNSFAFAILTQQFACCRFQSHSAWSTSATMKPGSYRTLEQTCCIPAPRCLP